MRKWRIEDSEELYNINGWGASYFSINEKGNVAVTPKKDNNVKIDLKELMDELQLRDVAAPVLLRFPDILTIGAGAPVEFQEAIRGDYPRYSAIKEPQMVRPGIVQTPTQISLNHQFVSADGLWRINLTSKFISLACSCYTRWEEFAARLDKPLAAFIRIYQPAWFDRVGLRYLNFFSRKQYSFFSSLK